MIGFIIAFMAMLAGVVVGMDILLWAGALAFGILAVIEVFKPPPSPEAAARGPKFRHKLLDAPQDAWEDDNEALWPFMMGSPGGSLMMGQDPGLMKKIDPFSAVNDKLGTGIVGNRMRDFLPFPHYGRQSILEQVFIGLPLSLKAIMKGKV